MPSQNQTHFRQFPYCLWEKSIKISLEIGYEWEEKFPCTKAAWICFLGFILHKTIDYKIHANSYLFMHQSPLEVQPLLESIADNEARVNEPRIEKAWIERAAKILSIVEKQASPGLRKEIKWWQTYLPDFVGKTGNEVWEMLPER